MRLLLLLVAALLLLSSARLKADSPLPFFLHDGDTVVFYGDSITEQQIYGRDVETWVLTHFPAWHVKFINSGWSGDGVSGGSGGSIETRLKRDVFPYKPTVVTIFLGMNDGGYRAYDPKRYQAYAQGLAHIVDELQQQLPNVRLTLLTPSFYDKDAAFAPHGLAAYNDTLIRYGSFVKELGMRRNIPVVDMNAPLLAATRQGRRTDPKFALTADGVHPSEAGHLILATALLQAWNAPPSVTDLALMPGVPQTIPAPLPWPLPDAARAAFLISPLPGVLDTFHLHFSPQFDGKSAGLYALSVDGKAVATLTGAQVGAGVNLPGYALLPENAQAAAVLGIVQDRVNTWRFLFKGGPHAIARRDDAPADAETDALTAIDAWLDDFRLRASAAAQPQPHTFLLREAPDHPR